MADKISWVVVAIIYLAIIYTLVKPASKGPTIVKNISDTLSDLVRGVTGQTFDPQTGKWGTGLWASKGFTTHWHQLTC